MKEDKAKTNWDQKWSPRFFPERHASGRVLDEWTAVRCLSLRLLSGGDPHLNLALAVPPCFADGETPAGERRVEAEGRRARSLGGN